MRTRFLSLDRDSIGGLNLAALRYKDTGEVDTERQLMIRVLRNIMNSELLTDRQRDAVRMRFIEGMSVTEVAAALCINPATACKHIKKAKRMISLIMLLVFPKLGREPNND